MFGDALAQYFKLLDSDVPSENAKKKTLWTCICQENFMPKINSLKKT